jgi:hypothetical protein
MKLYPPLEHTLSETEAKDLLDRLTAGVGEQVIYRPWQKHIPTYARVCFHEAAHAVSSVEHGITIRGLSINPDSGRGCVSTCDVSYRLPEIQRSEIEASILFAAPAAESLFAPVDPVWYMCAVHDMMLARSSLEFGADFTGSFLHALYRIGTIDNDEEALKRVYKRAKADALSDWTYKAVCTGDEAEARYKELVVGSCAWAFERREALLAVAVDFARFRQKSGTYINPRSVERSIKRILEGRPAHRSNRLQPSHPETRGNLITGAML